VDVLLNPEKYRNQTLTITGPKALSYAEAVGLKVTGENNEGYQF